jgi:PTH1 family peptidyl-tRNA hydrolase
MTGTHAVQLVAGLGNPGVGYAGDRHNAGFWLLDLLAERWQVELRQESQSVVTTVAACASYFRIPAASILVVHDELDLDPGAVRLKRGGGHGGHNGLRHVEALLGTSDFLRVRLGIGHPGTNADVSNYVLRAPTPEERTAIRDAIELVVDRFEDIVSGKFDRVMTTLNRRRDDRDTGSE